MEKVGSTLTEEDIQYLKDNKAMISQNLKVWCILYELSNLSRIQQEIKSNNSYEEVDKINDLHKETLTREFPC